MIENIVDVELARIEIELKKDKIRNLISSVILEPSKNKNITRLYSLLESDRAKDFMFYSSDILYANQILNSLEVSSNHNLKELLTKICEFFKNTLRSSKPIYEYFLNTPQITDEKDLYLCDLIKKYFEEGLDIFNDKELKIFNYAFLKFCENKEFELLDSKYSEEEYPLNYNEINEIIGKIPANSSSELREKFKIFFDHIRYEIKDIYKRKGEKFIENPSPRLKALSFNTSDKKTCIIM